MYKDTTKEKHEIRHQTGINWDQCNSNTKFTENLENIPEKTLNRFTTKDCYNWNITHNTESTAA